MRVATALLECGFPGKNVQRLHHTSEWDAMGKVK